MTTNTTIAAIKSMCTKGGNFISAGSGHVSVVPLPHDADTVQFVVAGESTFSITFIGQIGNFEWNGFTGLNVNHDSRLAAIDALNFMFESLKVKAVATEYENQVSVTGDAVSDSNVSIEFQLKDIHLLLDNYRDKPKLRM